MPVRYRNLSAILWVLLSSTFKLYAQRDSIAEQNIVKGFHADFLYTEDRKFYQDIYLELKENKELSFTLSCYRFHSDKDSLKIYTNKYHGSVHRLKEGIARFKIPFQGAGTSQLFIHPSVARIMQQTGRMPAGIYKIYVEVSAPGSATPLRKTFLQEQDSLLDMNASLRKGIQDIIQPVKAHAFLGTPTVKGGILDNAAKALEHNRYRLERYFRKKGLTPVQRKSDGKEIIDLYYEDWYVGRYEVASGSSLSAGLKNERQLMENNVGSFTRNSLGDYQSLQSQFRELKKDSRENKELTGELALSGSFSNDQEPGSQQSNRYYEARGNIEFPLFDIPVSVSGYYTTQDRHREAKASFIHFRYDAEKAKEQLLKLIGSYNKRYEQTINQGGNYSIVYGQFVQQLQAQKEQAIAGLKQQLALPQADFSSLNEDQIKAALLDKAEKERYKLEDSVKDAALHSGAAGEVQAQLKKAGDMKAKGEAAYQKALEQYQKIQELEKKIQKYQALLEQYRNTSYYDSLLSYSKLKDIKTSDETSYKDMAKKASGLLPEGKAKSVIAGLTNFDAGMFPKFVSDYTLSGQMLKGVDLGYDIGFAEIGGSYGKTEYVDREGKVEAYKAYSGRLQLKPILDQKLGLVYYGYSPGSKLLSDNSFFKDVSVSLPSFRNPVHIIAATYTGRITKFIQASGEYALTQKPGQSNEAAAQSSIGEKSAYNIKLEGSIPSTPLNIEAGYEHAGKGFENNTLPMLLAGTDRYRIKGQGDFFHAFLSLGIEYNYLVQNSFSAKGTNTKWGFNLATHSKRYPSVSLSYKPFSTFRSINDTLSIAQKPLLGEVWTGKISYQIKKQARAIRFTLLYNRNNSAMDTVHYNSTLLQFNTILSYKTTMLSLNLGSTSIYTDYIELAYPAFNNSKFLNVAASGMILETLSLSGGSDIATGNEGLNRYGFFAGAGYSFKKMPVMIRANFRYTDYKLNETSGWTQLYTAGIELAWRFKVKLFDY